VTIAAGERFADPALWEDAAGDGPHIWRTLGFERLAWEPGRNVVAWDATAHYAFPGGEGYILHGGMVTTILDTAMGGACWTVLDNHETFLTADINVEFFRATRPGRIEAEGRVVQRNRRVVFCAADLVDTDGQLLASARCTQVVLPTRP
jgi:uncharacterized protein (TIGR00369 family)